MDCDTFQFRQAVIDDIPSIQQVGKAAWTQTYAPLVLGAHLDSWSTEAFTENIEDPHSIIQVALCNDQVVGVALMSMMDTQRAHLKKLYVLPDVQRRGIGGQLLNECLALLPKGIASISTSMITGNQKAQRFYEKHGFVFRHAEEVEVLGYRISLTGFDKHL